MEIETALLRMGYRVMQPGVWGKPFAYQILIARIVKGKWQLSCHFKGMNDKLFTWDSKSFADLDELKYVEMEILHVIMNCVGTSFDFMTQEEMFAAIL